MKKTLKLLAVLTLLGSSPAFSSETSSDIVTCRYFDGRFEMEEIEDGKIKLTTMAYGHLDYHPERPNAVNFHVKITNPEGLAKSEILKLGATKDTVDHRGQKLTVFSYKLDAKNLASEGDLIEFRVHAIYEDFEEFNPGASEKEWFPAKLLYGKCQ